jgi:hypothetical protein
MHFECVGIILNSFAFFYLFFTVFEVFFLMVKAELLLAIGPVASRVARI